MTRVLRVVWSVVFLLAAARAFADAGVIFNDL